MCTLGGLVWKPCAATCRSPYVTRGFTLAASDAKALVHPLIARATARQVGSGTILFDLELRNAEDRFIASMHGVRMTDLIWKPDVDHLQPSCSQAFINLMHEEATFSGVDPTQHGLRQVADILDLVQHKKSICRILDIDPPPLGQDIFGDIIRAGEGHELLHRGGKIYAQGKLENDGSITIVDFFAEAHDHIPRQMPDYDIFDAIVCREVSQEINRPVFHHSTY